MEKYGVWVHPKTTRLCSNCGYKGYFKLRDALIRVPGMLSLFEICPKCDYEIELKEGEDPYFYTSVSDKIEKMAREHGMTIQEVIDEAIENIIPELDPKTGRIRFVSIKTGKEIKFESARARNSRN